MSANERSSALSDYCPVLPRKQISAHLTSADREHMMRRAAYFIDRILKGTKPHDLPIEIASHYKLAVNLKTAKALGILLPPSILLQATEVIE